MAVKLELIRLNTLGQMYPQIETLFQKHLALVRIAICKTGQRIIRPAKFHCISS
jgi:hypothetical protein